MKVTKLIIVLMATLSLSVAHAGEKKTGGIVNSNATQKGYGLAGCGLGSILFGPKPGGIQIVAATTNGTSYNQTFGITFGTLNCEFTEAGVQAAVYLENNREVMAKEAARGEGETLVGLANILKCSNQEAFNKNVQSNFEKIFVDSSNAYNNIRSLNEVISNDQTLKSSCGSAV